MANKSPFDRYLVFLVLRSLANMGFHHTAFSLERESGVFFHMMYFKELVMRGYWKEVERYLEGFTTIEENEQSAKIFFLIRRQKYYEQLERGDRVNARKILLTELKALSKFSPSVYEELRHLLPLEDFRENKKLGYYKDTKTARGTVFDEIKKLVEDNPSFQDKLRFPPTSNLLGLLEQSHNWPQELHNLPAPNIEALVRDHACQQQPIGQVHCEDLSLGISILKADTISQSTQGVQQDNQQLALVLSTGVPPMADAAISLHPANSVARLNHPPPPLCGNAKGVLKRKQTTTPSNQRNAEPPNLVVVRRRKVDKPIEESRSKELPEINDPSQCCFVRLPDKLLSMKVSGLLYSDCGTSIVALTSYGIHTVWKWEKTEINTTGKATASLPPQFYEPPNGILMMNEMGEENTEEVVHSFRISKNGSFVVSTSGGKISIFDTVNFKTMMSFMEPPPKVTCLVFHPRDNNILAIGMDDSSIHLYSIERATPMMKLSGGHQKRITGLAFSLAQGSLISAGSDGQLCKWQETKWQETKWQASKLIKVGSDRVLDPFVGTRLEMHYNQFDFLVVNEIQLAVHGAKYLECHHQLLMAQNEIITSATYSCDGNMIYASFMDGSVRVYTSTLISRCRINTITILSTQPSLRVPVVVAAHPSEPNQFALGLNDGSVVVFEPLESKGKWGTKPRTILKRRASKS